MAILEPSEPSWMLVIRHLARDIAGEDPREKHWAFQPVTAVADLQKACEMALELPLAHTWLVACGSSELTVPIEGRITGVLASAGRCAGRRMSACSFTPSLDGLVASVHVAPGGTSAALATAQG